MFNFKQKEEVVSVWAYVAFEGVGIIHTEAFN